MTNEERAREWLGTRMPYHDCASSFVALLDAAEARGRAEERQRVVAWLRTAPTACGVLIRVASGQDIARLADDIEHGEHEVKT